MLRRIDWFTNYLERSEMLRRSDWSTNFLEQSERLTRRNWSTNDVKWSEKLWREDWFINFLARREKLSFSFCSRKEINPSLLMSLSLRLRKLFDWFLSFEPLASLEVIGEPIRLSQQYSIFLIFGKLSLLIIVSFSRLESSDTNLSGLKQNWEFIGIYLVFKV